MKNLPKLETFDAWYYLNPHTLCNPEGDHFTPTCIRICQVIRQSREFSHLLHWRPVDGTKDEIMLEYARLRAGTMWP